MTYEPNLNWIPVRDADGGFIEVLVEEYPGPLGAVFMIQYCEDGRQQSVLWTPGDKPMVKDMSKADRAIIIDAYQLWLIERGVTDPWKGDSLR